MIWVGQLIVDKSFAQKGISHDLGKFFQLESFKASSDLKHSRCFTNEIPQVLRSYTKVIVLVPLYPRVLEYRRISNTSYRKSSRVTRNTL